MDNTLVSAPDLTLLANFIHQIINPLNGVIGTIDNIIDGTVSPDRRDQRLKAARAQLEWTTLLVRNLAYFADTSLTPGRATKAHESKTCVLPQVIIEAAQFFQEVATSRGIAIELEDPHTQYATHGSPDLLRQVFMNLFDNAVKYSDDHSKVIVRSWPQKKTGDLIIEVTNRGLGFSPFEREKLFEVSFRGKEALDKVRSGTGLGLHICKRIVEDLHGGSIEASYAPASRTATFSLRFAKWSIL